MEITYRWKDSKTAEDAGRGIAWNMSHVGAPEITQKGRRLTFTTPYEYTMDQVKYYAAKAGGKEVHKRAPASKGR